MPAPTRLMADVVASVPTTCMVRVESQGRATWHKRRKRGAAFTVAAGNLFLILARSRLRMFVRASAWRDRELSCFALLHGPAFRSGMISRREIWFDELPGESCRQLLDRGALSVRSLEAAARELFRVHSTPAPGGGTSLSHGDPHLGNVIYDPARDMARLIDFEQAHADGIAARWRHADDLLVFVLDILGRARSEDWPAFALHLLRAYPGPAAIDELRGRLVPPRGIPAVLWATRTRPLGPAQVPARLRALADAL